MIGAQQYLTRFYSSFGFQQVGEPYLEDGIPHIHMLLK
jgi:ElaA protein